MLLVVLRNKGRKLGEPSTQRMSSDSEETALFLCQGQCLLEHFGQQPFLSCDDFLCYGEGVCFEAP